MAFGLVSMQVAGWLVGDPQLVESDPVCCRMRVKGDYRCDLPGYGSQEIPIDEIVEVADRREMDLCMIHLVSGSPVFVEGVWHGERRVLLARWVKPQDRESPPEGPQSVHGDEEPF